MIHSTRLAGSWLVVFLLLMTTACDKNSPTDSAGAGAYRTDTVFVTEDARIASDNFNATYGAADFLMVATVVYTGGPTVVNRSLIRLPDLPLDLDTLDISSVSLVVTDTGLADSLALPVTISRVDSLWDESTVTFLNAPSPINPPLQARYVLQGQARFNVLPLYLDSSYVNGVVLGTV